jgi:hypothetical protein
MAVGSPKNFLREIDTSFGVESLPSANIGLAIGGTWGPANQIMGVTNKKSLAELIGKPILTGVVGANARTWMVCREILNNYTSSLYLVRAVKDDTTTKNSFLGVTRDASTHTWVNGANQLRYLNDDSVEPTVLMPDVRLKMNDVSGFVVGGTAAQLTSGASGTICSIDSANAYLYISSTSTATYTVVSAHTIADGGAVARTVTEVRSFESKVRLTLGGTEVDTFRLGEVVSQATSLAQGVVTGMDITNDYLYLNDIEGVFDGTHSYAVTGSLSGAGTVSAYSLQDVVGVNDVLGIYAVYAGVNGNDVDVAICDANNYYADATYNGTDKFSDEFETGPNVDYNYVEEVNAIVNEETDPTTLYYELVTGVRYALKENGSTANAGWDGAVAGDIVEWGGASWTKVTTAVDDFFFVKNENKHYRVTTLGGYYSDFAPELAIIVTYEDEIKERFIVSTSESALTVNSEPMFIDEFLENNSNYIRSKSRTSAGTLASNDQTIEEFSGYFALTALTGGTSDAPALADLQNAIDVFFVDESVDVGIIGDNHDLTTNDDIKSLQNHIIGKISVNKLKFGVFSLPSDVIDMTLSSATLATADAVTYLGGLTVESRAMITDQWKKIKDEYNYKTYYIPMTGDMLGKVSRTETDYGVNQSPAGVRRGIVQNADKLLHKTDSDVRDILFTNRCNSIFHMINKGVLLWGDKTLYNQATSAISSISGRRTLTQLEKDIMNNLVNYNFENSNADTWAEVTQVIAVDYLSLRKTAGWLYDYKFQCDDKNNPEAVQDNFEMYIDLAVKLFKTVRYIYLRVKIVKTSVSFDEVA